MKVDATGSTKREAWENLLAVTCEACTSKQDRNEGDWPDWIEMDEGRIEAQEVRSVAKLYSKHQDSCPTVVVGASDFDALVARNARLERQLTHARNVLSRIMADLPHNRDWLDPALEREARDIVNS